jgi:DNA-directed RNA polymerase subunit M/transcription elongation factor TFIIS
MLKNYRAAIRNTLETKFDKKLANNLENLIYIMCVDLSKIYDEPITKIYKKHSYEKVGQLMISDQEKITEIKSDIKNKILGKESAVYSKFHEKERQEIKEQIVGLEIVKGAFTCKDIKCRSDECYYYQSQTRSMDESATTYVICRKCGKKFHFN